jgi:hypothetical protein
MISFVELTRLKIKHIYISNKHTMCGNSIMKYITKVIKFNESGVFNMIEDK